MADLIDRQAAIEEIEKTINANKSIHYEMRYWEDGMNCALNIIEDIPSAQPEVDCQKCVFRGFAGFKQFQSEQPERKKGRWLRNDNGTYTCSVCQSWIPEEQHYYARYCLYCGADMRGGDDAVN